VEHFLRVKITKGKTVVQPKGVLDEYHRKAVALGLGVAHVRSAYLELVKATQSFPHLFPDRYKVLVPLRIGAVFYKAIAFPSAGSRPS